ncbi:serine-rich adhesin for platelets [Cheilinus undulatus]|uniref:serine-rich adhesin for platelets n=1 Tax=Cheilinus undulatus TaxID=241271 RepID=UPI001BD2E0A0|nr:serine-rich adhesin for platelets [Cheilinus undulatus]
MDSWTLQGDSYSFLRSAPRTFSLCHRDGTPNHVEIFDIINVPNQSSAISETTCLCDIFGDDCESPSLSSSPAVGRFIPPQREVEGTAAASPPVDDLNDSSGSYHTAHGSSEGEEGFDDSGERLSSPTLENEDSQRTKTGGTGHSEVSEDSNPNLEPKSKSPLQQLSAGSPSSEALNTGERTPPPGHKSPFNLTPARSPSSSSSSVEKRCSPSQHNPRQANSESSRITPTFKDKKNTDQDLTSSTSSLPRNCASISAEPSNTQSFTEVTAQASPEPSSSYFSQSRSPPSEDFSSDFSEPACKSRTPVSSPLSSFSGKESSPHSRGSSAQSYTSDTPASSPFQELTGRISLPDLFSRGSTPDREASTHSPSTTGREITTTPASQNRRSSTEPLSTVSTPAPQYTPPSPISRAAYPELVESRASSEIRNTSPSPCLLSAASLTQTGTRSPSPAQSNRIRQFSTPGTQVSSPVISYSLSPSPEVTRDCSPTAPSPEIRIIASSPDTNRREWLSEVKSASASPLREFSLASSRSPTSSPHITGISYSVVQPEDRDSPPFPELQRLSTPEPDRTLSGSPEAKSPSRDSLQSSTAEPSDTQQDSTHISGLSSPVPQRRYHTPSPRPKHLTPSPEVTYQTISTEKYHSPSPQERSKDPSSVVESPEQRFYQPSPSNFCSDNKQPSPPLRNTPDVEENQSSGRIRDTVLPASLEKQSVSPSFTFNRGEKSENKSLSTVVIPVTISPEEKEDNSLRQSLERDATPKRAHLEESVSLDSFSEEPICPSISQKEEPYNNLLIEIKSSSPDLVGSQGRSPNISTVHKASSITPLQGLGTPLTKHTSYSLNSPAFTPGRRRKLLPTIIRRENREIFTEDMAHHANRRRTPSPPLTRFTPVHIIAPEKPYRQWQNRSRSPSQFLASSNSGNLKKVVTNREKPNVALVDNNSQAHWVSQGTQLEMEKQMQLEEDREVVRERLKDREIEKERKREEQVPEKGKGWQGDATYRGEQAELSLNARNRKGPVSCRTAPTSREIRQALPTVHSYSESLLATRRLQQHSLLASQQDHRGVGSSRRQQPPALQNRNTTPRRVASNRPGRSSSSSMGSELDETDNEVKWFTDVAFSSLSSPEADYLDMYNSSHHSSTNISQSSTQESPAGVNAAWPAYADFRGSAQKLDNDDLSFQQPYPYYSDGLDPSRRYELGSFECVDVAMEREDHRKVRRGVPKRQIQLKRKNAAEVKQDESSENSSPGAPVMVESSSLESHSSETFMRQQITPAAMEECYPSERSPEPNQQNKLQKSASLDESCAKTKMATCLIQSVLSKKIQSGDKQQNEQAGEEVSPSFEEAAPPTETVASPFKESPKPTLSSSLQSDFSVSSEGPSVKGEPNIKDKVKMTKSFGVKSSNRPSSSSSSRSVNFSQTESEDTDSDTRNATSLKFESKSEKKSPCDYKHPRTEAQKVDDKKTWDETVGGESANASEGNTGAPSVTRARTTNRDQECENTEDHKQLQQGDKSAYTSSTPEITVKAVEKKKASLNVCLTPEADDKPEGPSPDLSFTEKEEREEAGVDDKIEEEEANGNSQVKVPIHKVRDVRRLVKNTYNLSFKATGAAAPSTVNEEQMQPFNQEITDKVEGQRIETVKADEERREDRKEDFMERKKEQKEEVKDSQPLQRKRNPPSRPQPMQIEYRAVCSKDGNNKMSCSKSDSESLDDKSQASPKLPMKSSTESQMSSNANSLLSGETATISPSQHDPNTTSVRPETVTVLDKVLDNEGKPVRMDRKPPMLGSLPRQSSKEREVSTAVVLIRDGSSKTKTTATQEEVSTKTQAPAASPSPGPATSGSAPGTSGHSVSMLLKEKGYQADIGAVMGDKENGLKGVPCKHVNSLEIPLQATASSDEGQIQSHRERTFSASSNKSTPSAVSENTDILTKTEDEGVSIKPTVKDPAKQKSPSPFRTMNEQTQPPTKPKELGDFEAVKRLDPTFPPRSPAIRRFRPQAIEVKSLSKDTQKQETPTNGTGNNMPQTIEVKSIAKNSQKPIVPPKPTCKFKPADLGMMPNEAQRPSATSTIKPQGEERSQTIVVSSPTIYRKISSDSTSTSHSARKLAVSAVSSIKPPPCKTAATTITSLSNQPAASFDTDTSTDRGQQPGALPQSSGSSQRATTLAVPQTSATGTGLTSDPSPVTAPNANQVPAPVPTGANQPSQPAVVDQDFRPPHPRMAYPHEQAMPAASSNAKQPPPITTTQVPGYTHQTYRRSLSGERSHRTEDMQFYASDDPPSYDDRESFSPLMLPDLATRRSNRYQPSTRPPPCSCTTGCPSHPGLTPPHYHRSPHNLTPPAPTHSPGQPLPYPVTQPPLRPHQCRPDPQPMTYQPGSPKSSPLGPSQPPAMYQSLHPPPGPPHPSLMHACPAERPLQPSQHIDPRRAPVHRSPQQQPPGVSGAPYSDPVHGHSPALPPMDPQYLCGPQSLGPSYGSEYGGDTSSLYSESSYGQAPRRVLLDPETGKYFYIEVPVQPLRKMLYDPETGQYVEVLIPQQAMSHSGLYPPSAAPYPSLHNPNMYAPAPQYMPYAAPPPPAHPQTQPQPPRYPEPSAAAAPMHPSGPGVSYRNPSGQGSKPEPQNHPPLDQSYLESMYYVPTGMNASPNPTPPDYYHKHPPNLPPTGGKRS